MADYASLDDLIREHNARKPTSDGSGTGFASTNDYYKEYADALKAYGDSHANDENFDYTRFKIQSDYVNQQAKSANDAYQNYLLTEKNALNAKGTMANIQDQTMKYLQGQQQAQGLAGQGVTQSVQAGVGNQYADNVMQIEQNRQEQEANAYQAYLEGEREAATQAADKQYQYEQGNRENVYNIASALMENGTSYDEIIAAYGDQLTDDQKKALQLAGTTGAAWFDQNTLNGQGYSESGSAKQAFTDQDGKTGHYNEEINWLFNDGFATKVNPQNGDTCMIQGNNGSYCYVVYRDGKWYQTSAQTYNNGSRKIYINKKKGITVNGSQVIAGW